MHPPEGMQKSGSDPSSSQRCDAPDAAAEASDRESHHTIYIYIYIERERERCMHV